MSDLDANININEVLQIIRFGGDATKSTLNFALKGSKKAVKGIGKTASVLKVKNMQIKLFMHYHSKAMSGSGKLKGMSLHSLEKLTGGNYSIINLPTEDKEVLNTFFKTLKKGKIAYSVLPDLVPNNGFSQIAVDPSQAHRLEAILDVFDFEEGKTAKESVEEENKGKEISLEEYWNTGNQEEKDKIVSSAIEQAEKESSSKDNKGKVISLEEYKKDNGKETLKKNPKVELQQTQETKKDVEKMLKLEKLKERHHSRDYYPVTIDKKMIVAENENAYVTRVPRSYDSDSGNFLLMTVDKNNAIKTNNGETILTHIRKDGQTYICDRSRENGKMVKNRELYRRHYSEYGTDFDKKKVKVYSKNKNATQIHLPKNLKK